MDGLIEQWGYTTTTTENNPLYFSVYFTSTNYIFTGNLIGSSANSCCVSSSAWSARTKYSLNIDYAYGVSATGKGGFYILKGY